MEGCRERKVVTLSETKVHENRDIIVREKDVRWSVKANGLGHSYFRLKGRLKADHT